MVNYTKCFLVSLISTVIGIVISSLVLYLAIDHIATFWALLIIVWIIISAVSGYILKDLRESIISTAFTSGIIFVFVLLLVVISANLSTLFLELLYSSQLSGINEAGIITQVFVISIELTLIIGCISLCFSFLGTFISNQIMKSKIEYSTADYESQFFKQYESPSDAGQYQKKFEDEDF
ncbi:MAG: hypothetical protein FK732_05730 [Asgard group archaeon]|nr:hypothetical protein [Asgard group archaeon]